MGEAYAGRDAGYSVIELVVVIAITGLVAALGVSAYRTYSIRAEVAQGIELAGVLKPRVVAAFKRDGEAPANWHATGAPEHTKVPHDAYVESLAVADGRIDVTFGRKASEAIAGRRLSLTPYETAGLAVIWVCGNEIPEPGLKPLGFAGGGRQAVQIATTVEPRYLPSTCR
jgi:type IV pilus assembly protein PilA